MRLISLVGWLESTDDASGVGDGLVAGVAGDCGVAVAVGAGAVVDSGVLTIAVGGFEADVQAIVTPVKAANEAAPMTSNTEVWDFITLVLRVSNCFYTAHLY